MVVRGISLPDIGRFTSALLFAVVFWAATLAPHPLLAHEVIPGITGFPALMLHPFLVMEQLLCLVAAVLVVGRLGAENFLRAFFAMLSAVLLFKGVHIAVLQLGAWWYLPVIITFVAGLTVMAFRRIALLSGLLLIFLLMGAYSVAILPEEATPQGLYAALAAALASAALLFIFPGLLLNRVESFWGGILLRIAGAWIAAISMMYLALAFRMASGIAA